MKEELKYNLNNYLITNSKKQIMLSILIAISLIIFIIISFSYSIYTKEKVNAITSCTEDICTLNFYHYDISKNNFRYVEIKNKKYKIESINFSEPELDNTNTIFQNITLELKNYSGKNNEIVEINIIKNKEKIIKKIFEIIVER